MSKVYLAGPFFNEAQIELISSIEDKLTALGVDFYSPRLSEASKRLATDRSNPDFQSDCFEENLEELVDCDLVLAIMDYRMPLKHYVLHVVAEGPGNWASQTPVQVPDTGTVWELGFSFAHGKPVWAFFAGLEPKQNLMTSRCCTGVLRGFGALDGFLDSIASSKGDVR